MRAALTETFRTTFGRAPEIIARAPGRIEFIGNHTDYNGGTVLGAAINRGVWVALAGRDDGRWRFASDQRGRLVEITADDFAKLSGVSAWANYPLGVLAAILSLGLAVPDGFDYLAMSDLPAGAGLSSSAALELSSAMALLALVDETPPREVLVKIARHAENNFVGVPCGVLDQGVSAFGKKDHLVLIDCRVTSFTTVPLPAGVNFWIFNTHTKHALVDGLYAERHGECMAAAKAIGVAQLAEIAPEQLSRLKQNIDPLAAKRAHHVVSEIARVGSVVASLRAGDLAAVGRLLTASHRSSQSDFDNSTVELDFLVDALERAPHVFGARLTGGGFGGAVMAMTSANFSAAAARVISDAYGENFGAAPDIFHLQTADGAELILG